MDALLSRSPQKAPFLRGSDPGRFRRPSDAEAPASQRAVPRASRSLSPAEAQRLLDAPAPDTLQGLRDRAILAVALALGATRSEIAALRVNDFQSRGGYDCLRLGRARGTLRSPLHPRVGTRLREYMAAEGHANEPESALFRMVRRSARARRGACGLRPAMIDLVVRKYAEKVGLGRGCTILSLREAFEAGGLDGERLRSA